MRGAPLLVALTVLGGSTAIIAQAQTSKPGQVVRVEVTPSLQVHVPAGNFVMGVATAPLSDEELAALELECQLSEFPQLCSMCRSMLAQELVTFDVCGDYDRELSLMKSREVYLDAFRIDRREVSMADYRQCVAAGGCAGDPIISGDTRYLAAELPMTNVTWHESLAYCQWRGARLPTEAEWEKAARGTGAPEVGGPRSWPWGNAPRPDDFNHGQVQDAALRALDLSRDSSFDAQAVAMDKSDGAEFARASGSYPWGAGAYGTFDQAGNVAEWVADLYTEGQGYDGLSPRRPIRDQDGVSDSPHVVRGGSWLSPATLGRADLRDPANRLYQADLRFVQIGFRCAADD